MLAVLIISTAIASPATISLTNEAILLHTLARKSGIMLDIPLVVSSKLTVRLGSKHCETDFLIIPLLAPMLV